MVTPLAGIKRSAASHPAKGVTGSGPQARHAHYREHWYPKSSPCASCSALPTGGDPWRDGSLAVRFIPAKGLPPHALPWFAAVAGLVGFWLIGHRVCDRVLSYCKSPAGDFSSRWCRKLPARRFWNRLAGCKTLCSRRHRVCPCVSTGRLCKRSRRAG